MNKTSPTAIRLTRTPEVIRALALAKKDYPTLSDPEILKVGLAKLTTDKSDSEDMAEIRQKAGHSLNIDGYLEDPREDIYHLGMGKEVNF